MTQPALDIQNLGKRYRLGATAGLDQTFREMIGDRLGRLFRHGSTTEAEDARAFWALRDVSFQVNQGEVLGLIGRNGAGKSTLLKILSRITDPTEGEAWVNGRVGSLLEVGTGFHPELTGRENIYLNGSILGMRRSEIRHHFDQIVEFSGIEAFLDTPVKRYSSGMYVRLAFAVAAHLKPEILLIDEVLAVGDAAFQRKCIGKMSQIAHDGRTVLFVSHNMAAVENLCDRCIVLERGGVTFDGDPAEAIRHYLGSTDPRETLSLDASDRVGNGQVRITHLEMCDEHGRAADAVRSGRPAQLKLRYRAQPKGWDDRMVVAIRVSTELDAPVFTHHNRLSGDVLRTDAEQGVICCDLPRLPLPPGHYHVTFSLMNGREYVDRMSRAHRFTVVDGDFHGTGEVPPASQGVCLVDASWSVHSTAEQVRDAG